MSFTVHVYVKTVFIYNCKSFDEFSTISRSFVFFKVSKKIVVFLLILNLDESRSKNGEGIGKTSNDFINDFFFYNFCDHLFHYCYFFSSFWSILKQESFFGSGVLSAKVQKHSMVIIPHICYMPFWWPVKLGYNERSVIMNKFLGQIGHFSVQINPVVMCLSYNELHSKKMLTTEKVIVS